MLLSNINKKDNEVYDENDSDTEEDLDGEDEKEFDHEQYLQEEKTRRLREKEDVEKSKQKRLKVKFLDVKLYPSHQLIELPRERFELSVNYTKVSRHCDKGHKMRYETETRDWIERHRVATGRGPHCRACRA